MKWHSNVIGLVGDIYDCAIEPTRWPDTLGYITAAFGGKAVSLSVQDPLRREARFFASWGIPDGAMTLYNERYAQLNPLLTTGWYCDVDDVVTAIRYVGEAEFFASRYYREFTSKLGWLDGLGVHLAKSANRYSIMALVGGPEKGPFDDDDIALGRMLAPHLRRAVMIADLLETRSLHNDGLAATLDLLTVAVYLIDKNARIAHANRAAEQLLEDGSVLRRDGDNLSTQNPRSSVELRAAIEAATSGHTVDLPRSGIAVPLPSPSGRDLAAWVLPLDAGLRRELAAPFAAGAAIVVREIGDTSPFPGELFVKRYGITPAECRVLMMLTQGMTPAEGADCLGISLPTAKTHMKRLFEKTGTRGQPDLMRLAMSALAPAVR